MSPIGRVFLVLNLALAGGFVFFAGTYLQRDDDFKSKFEAEKKQHNLDNESKDKLISSEKDKYNISQQANNGLQTKSTLLEVKLKEANDANTRLQARLDDMQAFVRKVESYNSKIDSTMATLVANGEASQKMAIASQKAKDDMETRMNKALAELADAKNTIANQTKGLGDRDATIAMRDQTIREKDVLLDIVNARYPGIWTTLTPLVTGSVSAVGASGKLVTIDLKSGSENLKVGHTFALFSTRDGYKGEARVTEIDGGKKYAFARLTLDKGKKIESGDSASTDLSRAGGN
ncbi:MAG: hypothetical protein KDC87_07160 [Planctomycetes bacterium]|nr:hypothetical protein [Planctomycetota bacterium]MCB9869724.1 hypothetical protein [Planctomycetota bacterium]